VFTIQNQTTALHGLNIFTSQCLDTQYLNTMTTSRF